MSSALTPESRPPTIYDVAREAGVSSQTVVRYLSGFVGMTPKTKAKVQGAVDRLGYRPNQLARALRMSTPRRILLFVHELSEAGPSNIILAAHEAAVAAGFVLEIVTLDVDDVEATERVIRESDQSHVAGALALAPTQAIADLFEDFPKRVPLLREVNGDGLVGPTAQCAEDLGTRLQMEHVRDLGHRRMFLLAGPLGWFASSKRHDTAVRLAREFGIEIVGVAHGDWTAESGYRALSGADLGRAPTVVVSANDEMAMGALCALDERGRVIPAQISVIGFDDTRGAAYFRPPLTTIHVDFRNAGRIALQRLLVLVSDSGGPALTSPLVEVVAPTLVRRRSTAPPPR